MAGDDHLRHPFDAASYKLPSIQAASLIVDSYILDQLVFEKLHWLVTLVYTGMTDQKIRTQKLALV